jgi:energy-coupling factor transporter ATP-binding protein EcfA2
LGTDDEAQATELRDELNALLADEAYWSAAARPEAAGRYAARVVEIFYHGMEPDSLDFSAHRDAVIPLPSSQSSDYRRALLLGTTGAGKTTLLRQLIGTDPETEKFPSTSTAKTTVHDTEVVLDNGPYRGVVTFFPLEEVREHLNECVSAAVLAAYRHASDAEVLRRLLMHVNQRFRFNYVLGNGPGAATDEDADQDEFDDESESFDYEGEFDLEGTNALLGEALNEIRSTAKKHGDALREELAPASESDQRVVDELFEEALDQRLREDEDFHALTDRLMDEIEKRFDLLPSGSLRKSKQGWPISWSIESDDRAEFIKAVTRFSSNYAPRFGSLLTPLVNGLRVAGPLAPAWNDGVQPPLVLLDGEGLGHTPRSSAALSTSLVRRIESADAVILVDNATQPMQAAAVAAMRELVVTGNARKLLIAFTHFDEVKGDNLLNNIAREQHVLASAENVLSAIGEDLGPFAEKALRGRLDRGKFFLGGLDGDLTASPKGKRTIAQLKLLLMHVDGIVERPEPVLAKPVYDRMNLVLAVKNAAEIYHDEWWARLGLSGSHKEHWTRIKALSRRLSTPGMADEYAELKPVADLRKYLQQGMYVLLQNPVTWEPSEPRTDDEKETVFNALADSLSGKLLNLATRRVRAERLLEWQEAYNEGGRGSSYRRASIIGERIYERAAPVPDAAPSPDRNSFLHEVAASLEEACSEIGAILR